MQRLGVHVNRQSKNVVDDTGNWHLPYWARPFQYLDPHRIPWANLQHVGEHLREHDAGWRHTQYLAATVDDPLESSLRGDAVHRQIAFAIARADPGGDR